MYETSVNRLEISFLGIQGRCSAGRKRVCFTLEKSHVSPQVGASVMGSNACPLTWNQQEQEEQPVVCP